MYVYIYIHIHMNIYVYVYTFPYSPLTTCKLILFSPEFVSEATDPNLFWRDIASQAGYNIGKSTAILGGEGKAETCRKLRAKLRNPNPKSEALPGLEDCQPQQ